MNHCTLTGILARDPITRFADHGTLQVCFTLRVDEPGPSGQRFTLFVPCEAYSRAAEQAGELPAAALLELARRVQAPCATQA